MNKIKYILITLIGIGLLGSCDDKLDVENPNAQDSSGFWKTESEISEGVTAIYNRLLTDGCYARMTPSLNDVRGDDVWSESPWTIYPLTGDFTVFSEYDVLSWMWREWFIMVYRANLVLDKANGVSFTDESYKNRLVGQALFLRAFAYYNLTESYEQVPLSTQVQDNADEYYPETNSRDEILAQIVEDLTTALDMLPESYDDVNGVDAGQTGRATWGAAAGLLARVYMIQERWPEAENLLSEIIKLDIYELVPDYSDNFTYSNENNIESLFEVQFGNFGTADNWWSLSTSDWRQAHCIGYNYGLTEFTAWGDLKPTHWLYEQFKKERTADGLLDPRLYSTLVSYEAEYDTYTDGRTNEIFGVNPYTDNGANDPKLYPKINGDSIFIAKYTYSRIPGHSQESDGVMLNSIINYRVIRYAEILLNYAEVLCMQGQYGDALPFINQIRERANLSTVPAGSLSDEQIWDELMHQRVLELSIEGIRHFDIKRWGWFYKADKLEELKSHDDEFETWVNGKEYLPIPSSEMDLNPNLSGNSNNNGAAR